MAFGGEAQAVASSAEWLRDGLNQTDSAAAVGVFEIAGRLAGMAAADGRERAEFGFEDAADGVAIEDVARLPMLLGIERHVFDESQFEAALAREAGERNDFVFGEPLDGDGVEAYVGETGVLGRGDSGEDAVEAFAPGDFLECFFAERVEADVEAPRPAERSSAACSASKMPLVVRARSSIPGRPPVLRRGAAGRSARAARRR